jgi:hypothetical protein
MQDAIANPVFVQELKEGAETGGEAPILWDGRLDARGATTWGDSVFDGRLEYVHGFRRLMEDVVAPTFRSARAELERRPFPIPVRGARLWPRGQEAVKISGSAQFCTVYVVENKYRCRDPFRFFHSFASHGERVLSPVAAVTTPLSRRRPRVVLV